MGCLPVRWRPFDVDPRAGPGLLWVSAAAHFASLLRGVLHPIGPNSLSDLRLRSHPIVGVGHRIGLRAKPYFQLLPYHRAVLSCHPACVRSSGQTTSKPVKLPPVSTLL